MALLVSAVFLAWSNSFSAPFEFDDSSAILENPTIRDLAGFRWLAPPAAHGETVGGRPLLNFTLAVNHAISGFHVWSYHLFNVCVHALAALVLFDLIRRTLAFPEAARGVRGRETGFALAVAAIWAVHPVQTGAVTYIVQRAESMMSLFYLLTLYGIIRAASVQSSSADLNADRAVGRRARGWFVVSCVACALGMAVKENMVSAPVAVLLYDRGFLSGSFAAAWRKRRRYYLALAATWIPLGVLVASTGGDRGGTSGFDVGVGWLAYLLTQVPALARYLALAVWPHPLVFEYGTFFVADWTRVLLPGLLVCGALVGIGYAIRRRPRIGFLAAIPAMLLAPTSLIPGTLQMIVEYRMYLAIAPMIVLICYALVRQFGRAPRWIPSTLAATVIVAFGILTFARNRAYRSEISLWEDTVLKAPGNPRAHNNLGFALYNAGQIEAAKREYLRAIELQPNHAFAHFNLGTVLMVQHRWTDAAAQFQAALAADPHYVSARVDFGRVLTMLGRPKEAIEQYRLALEEDPAARDAETNLAGLLVDEGRSAEAMQLLRRVLVAEPHLAEAHYQLGMAMEKAGESGDAAPEYRAALRWKPAFAPAHVALGNLLVAAGNLDSAEQEFRLAIRETSDSAEARFGLGNIFARRREFAAAADEYERALRANPGYIQARNNLANCELAAGAFHDAIDNYEKVLRVKPEDQAVRRNLEIARELQRGKSE